MYLFERRIGLAEQRQHTGSRAPLSAQCRFAQGFTSSGLAGHFSGAVCAEGSGKLKPYQLVSVPRTTS